MPSDVTRTTFFLGLVLSFFGPISASIVARITNTDQLVQIGDREAYSAKLTTLIFHHPICILALEIHTLEPLTGAEDIEITHSLCDEATRPNLTWTLAHYTNNKNVFVLRHPVLAKRLAIIAGYAKSQSNSGLTVLDVDIKQCDAKQVFGNVDAEEKRQKNRHCKNPKNGEHKRRHKHKSAIQIADIELDQLLVPESKTNDPDSIEAVFVRQKRQTSEDLPSRTSSFSAKSAGKIDEQCPAGFLGQNCLTPDCSSLGNCSDSGICVKPNSCQCFPNYSGEDCSQCSGWFCNQCDFYCVHGFCDSITKSCICRPGWSGAACDVCRNGNCLIEPRIRVILPQTAPWSNQNQFLLASGIDLPQGEDSKYHCLFGSTSTLGHWMSNELVQCPIPQKVKPGKHVFNLIPFGDQVAVPNENSKTFHFTFFVPCDPFTCRGNCLGPVCLCNHYQTGENCLLNMSTPQQKSEVLTHESVTTAFEGVPYVVNLPVNPTAIIVKVETGVDGFVVDVFRHQLRWNSPRGSTKPYKIKVNVVDNGLELELTWNLMVVPSYSPITGKVEPSGINNGFLLSGIIQQNQKNLNNVPVLLEVLSSKNQGKVVDSVEVTSESKAAFSHVFYPFVGAEIGNETFTVRAKHPGQNGQQSSCATWRFSKLVVERAVDNSVVRLINETARVEFKTNAKLLNCQDFDVVVIEPAEILISEGWALDGERLIVDFFLAAVKNAVDEVIDATIAFRCDTFNGVFAKLQFDPFSSQNQIKVTPPMLYFYGNPKAFPPFQILEIELLKLEKPVTEPLITATSLLPFFVAASTPPYLQNSALYQNGTKIKLMLGLDLAFKSLDKEVKGFLRFGNQQNPLFTVPYLVSPTKAEVLDLIVVVQALVNQNSSNAIDYPLEIVISSVNSQVFIKRMIYANVRAEFYPLRPDFYRISLRSPAFESFQTVFKLTWDQNTLDIFLEKKRQIMPIVDDFAVRVDDLPVAVDPSIQSRGEVLMNPSTFFASDLNQEKFVDIVFRKGPLESTAILQLENQSQNSDFFVEAEKPINDILCVGCGIRPKIKITRNPRIVPKTDCNVVKIQIPFVYFVEKLQKKFESFFEVIVDKRTNFGNPPKICENEKTKSPIPESTTIVQDCAAAKLTQCQKLYHSIQGCAPAWNDIADDTLSIHVFAMFVKLKAACKFTGVDLTNLQLLIQCISSLDVDCPIVKQPEPKPAQTSAFNALFTQLSAISPLTQSLHGYFPALSTLETQLIDWPTHMAQFLHVFEQILPSFDFLNIHDPKWFDSMNRIIADNSLIGNAISEGELAQFPNWQDGKDLILRWNKTQNALFLRDSKVFDFDGKNDDSIQSFQNLVEKADKLKSLARQFGAHDPFTMLHDMLGTMFAKVDPLMNSTAEIARTVGFVEPGTIYENQEFEVSIIVTNSMTNRVLRNLRFQLEFLNDRLLLNGSGINYRIGPLFYSGGIPDYLTPQTTLTATWKVLPFSTRRLTQVLKQFPNIILTYENDGKKKVQRIRVPKIEILPERHVRIFALAYPRLQPRSISSQDFSMGLHIMNTGYSDLRNIKIAEFVPFLQTDGASLEETPKTGAFRIHAVDVDGKFAGYHPDVIIGELKSGKTSLISFNMTTLHNNVAEFKNLSLKILVDDDIPEYLDFRFFNIREKVLQTSFILFDGMFTDYRAKTYFFDTKTAKIDDLTEIHLLEKEESEESTPNSNFIKVVATFQRLMDESELKSAANQLSKNISTVFGEITIPEQLKSTEQLIRISEISPVGSRRQLVNLKNTWIKTIGKQKVLNFLDDKALPPSIASELTYEFLYGKPEDFNAPFFYQNSYNIAIPSEMVVAKNTVLGKIGAVSPANQKLNFSLVTKEDVRNFAIHENSGEILLVNDSLPDLTDNQTGICANVIVTDERGRQSIVPLVIGLPNNNLGNLSKTECKVFQKGSSVFFHIFSGPRSALKMMEFMEVLPNRIDGMHSSTTTAKPEIATTVSLSVSSTTSTTPSTTTEKKQTSASQVSTTGYSTTTTAEPETTSTAVLETTTVITTTKEPFPIPPDLLVDRIQVKTSTGSPNLNAETELAFQTTVQTTIPTTSKEPLVLTTPMTDFPVTTVSSTESTTVIPSDKFLSTTEYPVSRTTHLTSPDPQPTILTTPTEVSVFPGSNFTVNEHGLTLEIFRFTGDFHQETSTPMATTIAESTSQTTTQRLSTTTVSTPKQESTTEIPKTSTSDSIFESIPSVYRITTQRPNQSPSTAVSNNVDDVLVNLITIPTPPTAPQLPIATGVPLSKQNPKPGTIKIGQIQTGNSLITESILGEQTSASMIDTACRLRDTKPIWAVVCDMAKTIHFKPT